MIVAEAGGDRSGCLWIVAPVPHRLDLGRSDAACIRHRRAGHAGEDYAGEDAGMAKPTWQRGAGLRWVGSWDLPGLRQHRLQPTSFGVRAQDDPSLGQPRGAL